MASKSVRADESNGKVEAAADVPMWEPPPLLAAALEARRRAKTSDDPDDLAIANLADAAQHLARLAELRSLTERERQALHAAEAVLRPLLRERPESWFGRRAVRAPTTDKPWRLGRTERPQEYARFVGLVRATARALRRRLAALRNERPEADEFVMAIARSLLEAVESCALGDRQFEATGLANQIVSLIRSRGGAPPHEEDLERIALRACGWGDRQIHKARETYSKT